jgi:hypothetical protein
MEKTSRVKQIHDDFNKAFGWILSTGKLWPLKNSGNLLMKTESGV